MQGTGGPGAEPRGRRPLGREGVLPLRYRYRPPVSLGEFEEMLGRLLDEIPDVLLEGLNGGVIIEPQGRPSREAPGMLVLGEYHHTPHLGRFIVLYYGSFVHTAGSSRRRWEEEMRATLRHELRHHVEDRAGLRDLEREDREAIRRYLEGSDRG
ncbi:MAG TPA: hypothetical protein DGR79_06815 [Clostridiales bacterium]|nr:hypothetical protein [Clostridiales bacterium]